MYIKEETLDKQSELVQYNKINEREEGIELLRIILMFMILLMHCFLNMGMLKNSIYNGIATEIAWLIEAFSIIAVNCYILISGYFLVDSKSNNKKIFKIIVQVLTYSLAIFIIFKLLNKDLSLRESLQCVLPVTLKTYWFITCYVVLYLIAPFLNIILRNTSKKQIERLLIITTLISWVSSVLNGLKFDAIDATKGYGILWFINLYFIAGYIKLYVDKNYDKNKYLILYFIISLIIYVSRILINLVANRNSKAFADMFYNYNSATVTVSSICLFLFFLKIKISNKYIKKAILKIAPLTFAIYIVHEHPLIKNVLYNKILQIKISMQTTNIFIIIFLSCLIIYIICCLIENVRRYFVKKLNIIYNKYLIKYIDNYLIKFQK